MNIWTWVGILVFGVLMIMMFTRGGCCGRMEPMHRPKGDEEGDGHDRQVHQHGGCCH